MLKQGETMYGTIQGWCCTPKDAQHMPPLSYRRSLLVQHLCYKIPKFLMTMGGERERHRGRIYVPTQDALLRREGGIALEKLFLRHDRFSGRVVDEHHVQGVQEGVHGRGVARYLRRQDEVVEVDIKVL
jgi:hypothetical protein